MWHQILQSLKKTKQVRVSWYKIIDFTDESVVQCVIPAVKNTWLDNDDKNDNHK